MLVGKHKDGKGYQYTAIKIAKFLGVSRETIRQKINEFLDKGLINCINPKGNPKLYEATPLSYNAVYGKQTTLKSVEDPLSTLQRPRRKIALQKTRYEITIDPELYKWIQSKIKTKEFSNLTHAVERGLFLLREKIDNF